MVSDRNFDDLAQRFERNVYGSLKGKIRLRILERDFKAHIPEYFHDSRHKRVLDLGAGHAHFSLNLATHGCYLLLNDISSAMLEQARVLMQQLDAQSGLIERVSFAHGPLQGLQQDASSAAFLPADLIICHAVLEWLAEPEVLFSYLRDYLKPGGYLSLSFYNINGLAFKNLLRTNYRKFDIDSFKPSRGSLTPTHPQDPMKVLNLLQAHDFSLIAKSGIRVFHDYILDPAHRERDVEGLLDKELAYSKREPFWQMARYIHYLCRYD